MKLYNSKKAQITVFIILAILILLGAGIGFYLLVLRVPDIPVKKLIAPEPEAIRELVETCIVTETKPLIEQISLQGGNLNLINFRLYQDIRYNYICLQESDHGCVNTLISRPSMENELNNAIKQALQICIDLTSLEEQGYEVTTGIIHVKTTIAVDDIKVQLEYPITISTQETTFTLQEFSSAMPSYLGRIFDLVVQITNNEINNSFFDQDEWMQQHGAEIEIEKHKPYPDTVYSLRKYNPTIDKETIFRFAIHGKDTVSLAGRPEQTMPQDFYGWCKTKDSNCYFNTKQQDCSNIEGTSSSTKPVECPGLAIYTNELCDGQPCQDCGITKHGESSCFYDSIVGKGFDFIGTRHYKASCFDGKIYSEECRDFREELCTEQTQDGKTKAVCRVNRWHDCSEQINENNCLDTTQRDCYWSDWLVDDEIPSFGLQRANKRCHPYVPPGFRFWQQNGADICIVANEQRRCDGFSCPQQWVDSVAEYCYFQGDCGNYRNIADKKTTLGFFSSDGIPRDLIYHDDGLPALANSYRIELPLDKREKQLITPLTYSNPFGTFEAIMQGAALFTQEAASWEICDFCGCFHGEPIGPCEFDETIFAASVCLPAQAPPGDDDCELCDRYSLKPCTEYRCHSLGQRCIYEEINGTGKCFKPIEGDTQGPVITFDQSIFGDFTVQRSTFTYADNVAQGYMLCRGDSCDDDEAGMDGLVPYSYIIFVVNLSEQASCKISPLPGINYSQTPGPGSQFSKNFAYFARVTPAEQLTETITELFDLSSMLEVGMIDQYDAKFQEIRDNTLEMLSEFGEYMDNEDEVRQGLREAEDQWYNNFKPLIEKIFEERGDAIQRTLIELESNRFIVFIRCIDKAGNENEQEFFIKYAIGQDTIAPIIEEVVPADGTFTADPLNLRLHLNEPADCRYGFIEDQLFDDMEHELDCPASVFDTTAGIYQCKTSILFPDSTLKIYVKCRDNPFAQTEYFLQLNQSDNFEILAPDYAGARVKLASPNMINITSMGLLAETNTTIAVNTSSVDLSLKTDIPSKCKYSSSSGLKYEDAGNAFTCTSTECKKTISTTGDLSMYIVCIDAFAMPRNTNTESYVLTYHKQETT